MLFVHGSSLLSSDGLGRTGTFIAIWSLIEQMKAEGQIDVVGTVKSIRTQRPGAVPHLVRANGMFVAYIERCAALMHY